MKSSGVVKKNLTPSSFQVPHLNALPDAVCMRQTWWWWWWPSAALHDSKSRKGLGHLGKANLNGSMSLKWTRNSSFSFITNSQDLRELLASYSKYFMCILCSTWSFKGKVDSEPDVPGRLQLDTSESSPLEKFHNYRETYTAAAVLVMSRFLYLTKDRNRYVEPQKNAKIHFQFWGPSWNADQSIVSWGSLMGSNYLEG